MTTFFDIQIGDSFYIIGLETEDLDVRGRIVAKIDPISKEQWEWNALTDTGVYLDCPDNLLVHPIWE